MSQLRPRARRGGALLLLAGLFAAVPALAATSAYGQSSDCPAGAPGGAGGRGGRSTSGNAGLGFTVPGFGTSGAVDARGGNGGSARGGNGGRGGSGTLPICNQNTNGVTRTVVTPAGTAPAGPGATGGGGAVVRGVGGGLARTGSRTYLEVGLAGMAFAVGGMLLFFGQPLRRTRRQ